MTVQEILLPSQQTTPQRVALPNAPPDCQCDECRGFGDYNLSYQFSTGRTKFHIEARQKMSLQYAYKQGQVLVLNGCKYTVVEHFGPCASAATYLVEKASADNLSTESDGNPTPALNRFVLKVFDPRTSFRRILTKGSPLGRDPDRVTGAVIPWKDEAEQWACEWRASPVAAEFEEWSDDQMRDESRKLNLGSRYSPEPEDLDKREWEGQIGDDTAKVEGCVQASSECAFRAELFAYRRLSSFQGDVIPKLYEHGQVTISGADRSIRPWALLLEHIEGAQPLSSLSQVPKIDPAAKSRLQQSVKSVCEAICKWNIDCGVLHDHLEPDHFLLTQDHRLVVVSFTRAVIAGFPPRVYDRSGKLLPLEGHLVPEETDEYTPITPCFYLGNEKEYPPIVWSPSAVLYKGTSALFQWLADTCIPAAEWKESLAYLKARRRSHPKESLVLLQQRLKDIPRRGNHPSAAHVACQKRRRAIETVFWSNELQSEWTRLEDWFKAELNAVKTRLHKKERPVPPPFSTHGRARLMPASLPDVALRNVRRYAELKFAQRDACRRGLTGSAGPSLPSTFSSTSTSRSTSDSSSSDLADSSVDLEGFLAQCLKSDIGTEHKSDTGTEHKSDTGTEHKDKSRYLMSVEEMPERSEWVYALWSMRHRSGVWPVLTSLAGVDEQTMAEWLRQLPAPDRPEPMGEFDPRKSMPVKQWRPFNALMSAVRRCERIISDAQEEKRFLDTVLTKKYVRKHRRSRSSSDEQNDGFDLPTLGIIKPPSKKAALSVFSAL